MTRLARLVVPGVPHHVTQRGARRLPVFFEAGDYDLYRDLLLEGLRITAVEIWAYCLMPNHVHLIAVPPETGALAALLRRVHQRYALRINRRAAWAGHLWQARFASAPMGETYLRRATLYVLLNPVRAGLVSRPHDWGPSSAPAHLGQRPDPLVRTGPLDARIGDWRAFLASRPIEDSQDIRRHTQMGRPLGDPDFVTRVEALRHRLGDSHK